MLAPHQPSGSAIAVARMPTPAAASAMSSSRLGAGSMRIGAARTGLYPVGTDRDDCPGDEEAEAQQKEQRGPVVAIKDRPSSPAQGEGAGAGNPIDGSSDCGEAAAMQEAAAHGK
mmetsp:Transcript_13599/g.28398  ORF Transcript_13599/g.28398 Transcript_13599/m.28398 type:complete len:115 (-) Transcript_13599:253-597(-)